jgi:ArsR family transcriptional regulator
VDSDQAIVALAALAQDHRLAAYRLLVQAGPAGLAAGRLAQTLDVQPSSLSFHLAQLCHAGLAVQRREGRSILYSVDYSVMNGLLAYLTENCCAGSDCGETPSC